MDKSFECVTHGPLYHGCIVSSYIAREVEIKGLIGCPNQAILAPFAYFTSFLYRVWFPASHALSALFHSAAIHHPARLRLLYFDFPRDAGRHDAPMV